MAPLSKSLIALIVIIECCNKIDAITFGDCNLGKNSVDKLLTVRVSNCEVGTYCSFIRGSEASIEIDFKAGHLINSALVKVYGKVGFIPLPLALNPEDACGNYGFDCPIYAGETKTLRLSLPIRETYPKFSITVQLKLFDEKKAPILCIEFPAKIVDSLQKD